MFGRKDICCWNDEGKTNIYFPSSYEDTTGRGVQKFTGGEVEVHEDGDNFVYFVIDRLEVWTVN